jgi:hypothetical protein
LAITFLFFFGDIFVLDENGPAISLVDLQSFLKTLDVATQTKDEETR